MAAIVYPRRDPPRGSWGGAGLGLAPPPATAPPYALRRLAAAVVLTLVVLLVASVVRTAAATVASLADHLGPGAPPVVTADPPEVRAHVVVPGDTYWSIAVSLGRPGDVRALVDDVVAANDARALQPGDRLVIPPP